MTALPNISRHRHGANQRHSEARRGQLLETSGASEPLAAFAGPAPSPLSMRCLDLSNFLSGDWSRFFQLDFVGPVVHSCSTTTFKRVTIISGQGVVTLSFENSTVKPLLCGWLS